MLQRDIKTSRFREYENLVSDYFINVGIIHTER